MNTTFRVTGTVSISIKLKKSESLMGFLLNHGGEVGVEGEQAPDWNADTPFWVAYSHSNFPASCDSESYVNGVYKATFTVEANIALDDNADKKCLEKMLRYYVYDGYDKQRAKVKLSNVKISKSKIQF